MEPLLQIVSESEGLYIPEPDEGIGGLQQLYCRTRHSVENETGRLEMPECPTVDLEKERGQCSAPPPIAHKGEDRDAMLIDSSTLPSEAKSICSLSSRGTPASSDGPGPGPIGVSSPVAQSNTPYILQRNKEDTRSSERSLTMGSCQRTFTSSTTHLPV